MGEEALGAVTQLVLAGEGLGDERHVESTLGRIGPVGLPLGDYELLIRCFLPPSPQPLSLPESGVPWEVRSPPTQTHIPPFPSSPFSPSLMRSCELHPASCA